MKRQKKQRSILGSIGAVLAGWAFILLLDTLKWKWRCSEWESGR
ncbi:MAG: hypothetical protein ABS900_10330 [Candidatus Limivicinus sp.]|jgi:hypothetical protein